MVIRYTLKCNHCDKTTLLRLAVGYEERQDFSFECENCSQDIRGLLVLNKERDSFVRFEISGASTIPAKHSDIFEKTTDFIVTIDPNFAYSDESQEESIITPFMQSVIRNNDDLLIRLQRLSFLNKVVEEGLVDMTRIIRNYVAENWVQFELGVRDYLPKDQPISLPIDRNRALYQLLELFLSPVTYSQSHAELILNFTKYTAFIVSNNTDQFDKFVAELESHEYLRDVQHASLDIFVRFLNILNEFRPVIMEWNFEDPDQDIKSDLKIKPKIGFHQIKSFYVDAYETVCKSMTIITGLMNIRLRGDYNSYSSHPTINNFANNIHQFHAKPNAPKMQMLAEEPLFNSWLIKSLDSHLRNSIGHNATKYDRKRDQVTYLVSKNPKSFATIEYSDFLAKTLRIFIRLHQVNHLVKIIYVHKYLPRNEF